VAVHLIKGLNSIIILGTWTLWNIRNRCVIDAATNLAKDLLFASGELLYWSLAGARGINNLLAQGLNESYFWVKIAYFVCQGLVCLIWT
jgi:hypothetical protein